MASQIPLGVEITNSYEDGDEFVHRIAVVVHAPTPEQLDDPDLLQDWGIDTLLPLTGEGPHRASQHAYYEAVIRYAPLGLHGLVGFEVSGEG
ncbi:MAG: hypothetical protein QM774_06695 [Gordonia sp. (in: high G+C Gram-positive bacteria)]|uniref:hypothetical protein n=1 Tax=Gordonia sp. (in: high G+C Gram-positive bacteria) TaxID=84139 RepID=UPI0039E45254